MQASELISQLQLLIVKHGDLPVLVAIEDSGAFIPDSPRYDTEDGKDACFII